MSLKKRVKDSKLFLTAKGKLVDTYELHAFGVGVAVSTLYIVVPPELKGPVKFILAADLGIAFGLQMAKKKDKEGTISGAAKDVLFGSKLRKQISKEGHYNVVGVLIPFLVHFLI